MCWLRIDIALFMFCDLEGEQVLLVVSSEHECASVVGVVHEAVDVAADEVECVVTDGSAERDHSEEELQTESPQHGAQLHLK